jgi:hypothetical protein
MNTLKLEVDHYVGFGDWGDIESMVFFGNEDKPAIENVFTIDELVKEFIDMRTIPSTGKVEECHMRDIDNLYKTFEKALKMLEAVK